MENRLMKASSLYLPSLLLFLLVILSAASCSGEPVDFSGHFAGDGLSVELRATADGYAGSFTLQDKRFEATGQRSGDGIAGEFTDGDARHAFTIVGVGDGLQLVTGGSTYKLQPLKASNPLTKAEPTNPLAKQPKVAPQAAAAANGESIDPAIAKKIEAAATATAQVLSAAPAFTKTYKHPSGIYFTYPDGWAAQPISEGAVSLTPDDLYSVRGERAELMIVVGEDAGEVKRVDHPDIVNLVEAFVRESFPYLAREGSAKKITVGSQPILQLRFGGSVSDTQMAASMQVSLLGGFALGTFTLAPKDRFSARQKTMTDVLRTFGYKKPQGDPRLVGSWRYSKTYISGTFSSITVRNLVLRADGTCLEGGKLFAGMTHQNSTGETIGSTNGESGAADYVGRWRAEGKSIVLTWDGSSTERWDFYIEGSSMLWKDGNSRKLWERR
jgi:hypothetical protein